MTSNAPHWLVLALVALGVSAYLACGLAVLVARARRRLTRQSTPRARALTSPRQPARARTEVTS